MLIILCNACSQTKVWGRGFIDQRPWIIEIDIWQGLYLETNTKTQCTIIKLNYLLKCINYSTFSCLHDWEDLCTSLKEKENIHSNFL